MKTDFGRLRVPTWNVDCYAPKTTFWQDFWIASAYGTDAIYDTYNRAMTAWKENHIYMTELALVLNHLGWAYHRKDANLACIFFALWEKHIDWCYENLKGAELDYFLEITD